MIPRPRSGSPRDYRGAPARSTGGIRYRERYQATASMPIRTHDCRAARNPQPRDRRAFCTPDEVVHPELSFLLTRVGLDREALAASGAAGPIAELRQRQRLLLTLEIDGTPLRRRRNFLPLPDLRRRRGGVANFRAAAANAIVRSRRAMWSPICRRIQWGKRRCGQSYALDAAHAAMTSRIRPAAISGSRNAGSRSRTRR
jgi:hypothetical protein